VKPFCDIGQDPEIAFASTSRCLSTDPKNPAYAVKLTVEDLYALSRVYLDEGVPYKLNRYVYRDANAALFRYTAPTGVFSAYGYLLIEVTAIAGNVPIVVGWTVDGCNFNTVDTVCTNTGGSMRCSLLVYPCNWQPGATYDFMVTAPVTATTGFTLKASGVTNVLSSTIQLYVGDSVTVAVGVNELKFFQVNLATEAGLAIDPDDRVIIELTNVGCGTVNAWINREAPGGPECNVNPGGKPCTTAGCVLADVNACDILTTDLVYKYFVSVVGIARNSTDNIKAKLRVRLVKGSPAPAQLMQMYDNEEHPIWTSVVTREPLCATISEAALSVEDDCCSLTPARPGANDTRTWRVDNTHYVYTVDGGHHLGSASGSGARITVGVRSEIQSALVYLIYEKTKFCETTPPTPCRVTETDRCIFEIRSCRQSVRQVFVWLDPNSIRWFDPSGRPNVPREQTSYQVGWVRVTKQEVSIVSVALPSNIAPNTPLYHPFWMMPGEITYIRIAHPNGYTLIPNYHVRISVQGVTNGPVAIAQASGWNSCSDGECVVEDCSFGDVENATTVGECRKKTANCYCKNLKDVSLPICLTEAADDDKSDYFQLQTKRTGSDPVYGRLKITLNELLVATNSSVCHSLRTGQHMYFKVPPLGGINHVYKITVQDMEGDTGGVRLSLNDDTIALPNTCAEKNACRANGGSCTLYYRKGSSVPGVTVWGDSAGKIIGVNGIHKFRIDMTSIPVTIHDLASHVTALSPTFVVSPSLKCLVPIAPEYYRITTRLDDKYLLITVIAHSANVWVNSGSLAHARGDWTCSTKTTGGTCSILIACRFKPGEIYFIHVEGGAHEITASAYNIEIFSSNLGESKDFSFSTPQNFASFLVKGVEGKHQDPSRFLSIAVSGPVLDSWITKDSFGSVRCKLPAAFLAENKAGNVLNKATWTHKVPSCYVGVQSDSFYLNTLSEDSECNGYIYHVSSYFAESDGSLIVDGTGPGKVPAGGVTRRRVGRSVLENPLGDDSVLVVKIRDASAPVQSVVWKSNFVAKPTCATTCSTKPTTSTTYWVDNCWHCGGGFYDTVFVEIAGRQANSTTEILYNLGVEHKSWTELSTSWISNKFTGLSREYSFYKLALKKDMGMMIEVEVLGELGVDIEIFPSDCHRRNLELPLSDQALKYKCYPSEGTCQIPFSKEFNWGSSSSQATYILSDDNLRVLVRGFSTSFRIRVRRGAEGLCSNVTSDSAPFCSASLNGTYTWGNVENFTPRDNWAQRWYTKLVQGFDCPVSRNCDCKPVSAECRAAIKTFACASSFGSCTAKGWKTPTHVDVRVLPCFSF
jgi:hypothetical protein